MALRYAVLCCIVAVTSGASVSYSRMALQNEVHNLPGRPASPSFRIFSGYIKVAEHRSVFYVFTESMRDPANDPMVLWTNGGPGCSGLAGFMTEQGPYRPTANGTLENNPHAWNTIANMVYIEQPAGVGFSYVTENNTVYNDANAAKDNAAFVRGFLELYSAFNQSDFYLTSESYGGHYLPTLARELVTTRGSCLFNKDCPGTNNYCESYKGKPPYRCHTGEGFTPNLKGFMVGNPLTYMPYRNYGQYGTMAGHNLLPKPLWQKYLDAGCKTKDTATCANITAQMDKLAAGLDPYALDFPVCSTEKAAGRHERHMLMKKAGKLSGYFPEKYTPCDTNWATTYLNRADVQKALGVIGKVEWAECSEKVGNAYSVPDTGAPMMPVYKELIDGGHKLRILVYSGDDDSVCATLGSQEWIWNMGYEVASPWAPWMMDKQVAGFHVSFGAAGSAFQFATVHGAGHMVPATRPAQSLMVFSNYINANW